uniref:Uncharacterized protein n=1 Tax=Oryza punctata TaxID=4537 RepID=A0A0E0M3M3_ORYPU
MISDSNYFLYYQIARLRLQKEETPPGPIDSATAPPPPPTPHPSSTRTRVRRGAVPWNDPLGSTRFAPRLDTTRRVLASPASRARLLLLASSVWSSYCERAGPTTLLSLSLSLSRASPRRGPEAETATAHRPVSRGPRRQRDGPSTHRGARRSLSPSSSSSSARFEAKPELRGNH